MSDLIANHNSSSEMSTAKIAVIGSGISGAVCASILAKNGVCVTMFESARGPGGRMSQRREISSDGNELSFDHGAPYFTARNTEVMGLAKEWESRGLVAEWKDNFGSFDCSSGKFSDVEQEEDASKRYVGVPGMNSICKALCRDPGVESQFGTSVGRLDWIEDQDSWSLTGSDGRDLGKFNGVVASDKNIVSPRFTSVTGRPPPLDLDLVPEMKEKLQNIPVHPCFALMLAFKEPLSTIPLKGFSIRNSEVLSRAHCDSTKPGRSTDCERWVVHSTVDYAERLISQMGLSKPTEDLLAKVSEDILGALQNAGLVTSHPFHTKAHRWGSAFPARSVASEEKCVWDAKKRIAICGDFCVSPDVEGSIISGIAAASKFNDIPSSL